MNRRDYQYYREYSQRSSSASRNGGGLRRLTEHFADWQPDGSDRWGETRTTTPRKTPRRILTPVIDKEFTDSDILCAIKDLEVGMLLDSNRSLLYFVFYEYMGHKEIIVEWLMEASEESQNLYILKKVTEYIDNLIDLKHHLESCEEISELTGDVRTRLQDTEFIGSDQ